MRFDKNGTRLGLNAIYQLGEFNGSIDFLQFKEVIINIIFFLF